VSISSKRPTRVLFLAWGPSVHARRRIQIFTDNPDFNVVVASTHDYNFENAQNILLTGSHTQKTETRWGFSESLQLVKQGRLKDALRNLKEQAVNVKILLHGLYILLLSDLLSELKIRNLFRKEIRSFYTSPEVIIEIDKSIKDIKILKFTTKQFDPDIIFLQTLLYPCYLSYFLPKSVPVITTFWNGDVLWWAQWTGIEALLKKHLVRYGVQRSQAVTVNSQAALNTCIGYGSQREEIHLIRYPGVDLNLFEGISKEEARRKLGIKFQKVVFLPRGLGGYLNSDIIVESAATVLDKYPSTLFLFVSDVGGEKELSKHQARTRELGIEGNFRWDGQVPWEEMATYYSSSDVMVSLSSNDSLPNCMLEAMACGVPVIMGDIPQIREVFAHGAKGFLVPPRDPKALSDSILEVFEGSGGKIMSFCAENLDLVRSEFDSKKSAQHIKHIVQQTAGHR
jgi:glycosyltransferase involved in cell wall biosynthesis